MGASLLYMYFLGTPPMKAFLIYPILLEALSTYLVIIEMSSVHSYYYPYNLSGRSHGYSSNFIASQSDLDGGPVMLGISLGQVTPFRTLSERI